MTPGVVVALLVMVAAFGLAAVAVHDDHATTALVLLTASLAASATAVALFLVHIATQIWSAT